MELLLFLLHEEESSKRSDGAATTGVIHIESLRHGLDGAFVVFNNPESADEHGWLLGG